MHGHAASTRYIFQALNVFKLYFDGLAFADYMASFETCPVCYCCYGSLGLRPHVPPWHASSPPKNVVHSSTHRRKSVLPATYRSLLPSIHL